MKPGDRVFVFPKAHGRKGAWGRVVEASRNDHSLTVVFEHKPHFSAADAFETVLIESSVNSFVLALSREQNTTLFWTDFTGRRYGISMLVPAQPRSDINPRTIPDDVIASENARRRRQRQRITAEYSGALHLLRKHDRGY